MTGRRTIRSLCSTRSVFLICAFSLLAVYGQECNDDTMKRCKRQALDELQAGQRSNADQQCRLMREHFDCLLFQTSMCQDTQQQENSRDAITRLWRYLQSFCESQGSWYTKQCFQRDDVRRCEALLPATRSYSVDTSSCRSFSTFRDCVTPIVQSECSTSDRQLLGTYLMEKGQQRAWNCPTSRSSFFANSAPLAIADVDSFTDSSSYRLCSEDARVSLQDCRSGFYSEQKDATTRNDSDMRHHRTCCALVAYEECVTRTLRDLCGESRGRSEARVLVSEMRQRFPYHSCEDHTATECSSASATGASLTALLVLILGALWKNRP